MDDAILLNELSESPLLNVNPRCLAALFVHHKAIKKWQQCLSEHIVNLTLCNKIALKQQANKSLMIEITAITSLTILYIYIYIYIQQTTRLSAGRRHTC
jgi:hypothetical protein